MKHQTFTHAFCGTQKQGGPVVYSGYDYSEANDDTQIIAECSQDQKSLFYCIQIDDIEAFEKWAPTVGLNTDKEGNPDGDIAYMPCSCFFPAQVENEE